MDRFEAMMLLEAASDDYDGNGWKLIVNEIAKEGGKHEKKIAALEAAIAEHQWIMGSPPKLDKVVPLVKQSGKIAPYYRFVFLDGDGHFYFADAPLFSPERCELDIVGYFDNFPATSKEQTK